MKNEKSIPLGAFSCGSVLESHKTKKDTETTKYVVTLKDDAGTMLQVHTDSKELADVFAPGLPYEFFHTCTQKRLDRVPS